MAMPIEASHEGEVDPCPLSIKKRNGVTLLKYNYKISMNL